MCGIAGHYCFGDARPTVGMCQGLLVAQEARGRSAAGVAFRTSESNVQIIKRAGPASVFARNVMTGQDWTDLAASPIALLHARATTQGPERDNENNHPVEGGRWLVTHNGMVTNDDDLIAHYGVERPAAVDTVAINLALSQGTTVEESLAHLSTLGGSATFAAWNLDRPGELILARINGPLLSLHHDARTRILYWSSDAQGIYRSARPGLGTLNFTNISALPQNSALVLYPDGRAARWEVARNPFFRSRARVEVVAGKSGAQDSKLPISGSRETTATNVDTRPVPITRDPRAISLARAAARQVLSPGRLQVSETTPVLDLVAAKALVQWLVGGGQAIFPVKTGIALPKDDYIKLGKPFPDFTAGRANLVMTPPAIPFKMNTPYGTWTQEEEKPLTFKGAKRVKPWWQRQVNDPLGVEVKLPANVELGEHLEGTYPLEPIELVSDGVHFTVFMCPWCGVMTKSEVWTRWNLQCQWCRVRSYRRK